MGIQGLLQAVKPVIKDRHISEFKGRKLAIDGYCWLHKSVYGCCLELCNGQESDSWIKYCLSYIDMLLSFEIDVTVVFDGASLPAKGKTEEERKSNREENLAKGRQYAKQGDMKAARNYYARAIDITPFMAAKLINIIKTNRPNVKYIVAPYEADAQLSFLSITDQIDCIVSEDSDTIPYDCKEMIYKLERDGSCQSLLLSDLYSEYIPNFDLREFSNPMVVCMCILAGCDYLNSLKSFGLKTSYKWVTKHKNPESILKLLRLEGKLPMIPAKEDSLDYLSHLSTEEMSSLTKFLNNIFQFELDYYKAQTTFKHQTVFDPKSRKAIHRTPITNDNLPECLKLMIPINTKTEDIDFAFLGKLLPPNIACGIADGFIDPETLKPFVFPGHIERPLHRANTISVLNSSGTTNNSNTFSKPILSNHKSLSNISYSSTSAQNLPSLGSLTSQFILNKIKRDTSDFLTSDFSDIQKSDKSTMSVYSFEEPDLSEEPFTIISPENKISSGSTIEKISKDQFFSNSSKRDYNGSLKNSSTKGGIQSFFSKIKPEDKEKSFKNLETAHPLSLTQPPSGNHKSIAVKDIKSSALLKSFERQKQQNYHDISSTSITPGTDTSFQSTKSISYSHTSKNTSSNGSTKGALFSNFFKPKTNSLEPMISTIDRLETYSNHVVSSPQALKSPLNKIDEIKIQEIIDLYSEDDGPFSTEVSLLDPPKTLFDGFNAPEESHDLYNDQIKQPMSGTNTISLTDSINRLNAYKVSQAKDYLLAETSNEILNSPKTDIEDSIPKNSSSYETSLSPPISINKNIFAQFQFNDLN